MTAPKSFEWRGYAFGYAPAKMTWHVKYRGTESLGMEGE